MLVLDQRYMRTRSFKFDGRVVESVVPLLCAHDSWPQGITPETLSSYLVPNVDVLSMGMLTQGYKTLDLSLKIQRT